MWTSGLKQNNEDSLNQKDGTPKYKGASSFSSSFRYPDKDAKLNQSAKDQNEHNYASRNSENLLNKVVNRLKDDLSKDPQINQNENLNVVNQIIQNAEKESENQHLKTLATPNPFAQLANIHQNEEQLTDSKQSPRPPKLIKPQITVTKITPAAQVEQPSQQAMNLPPQPITNTATPTQQQNQVMHTETSSDVPTTDVNDPIAIDMDDDSIQTGVYEKKKKRQPKGVTPQLFKLQFGDATKLSTNKVQTDECGSPVAFIDKDNTFQHFEKTTDELTVVVDNPLPQPKIAELPQPFKKKHI